MNIGLAILIKLLSVLLFAMMSALVRFVGDNRVARTRGKKMV
jgi:sorbitol-specific phosphotransferase system component IIC